MTGVNECNLQQTHNRSLCACDCFFHFSLTHLLIQTHLIFGNDKIKHVGKAHEIVKLQYVSILLRVDV